MKLMAWWPLLFLWQGLLRGPSAQSTNRGDLCFVWYNVENLFYPEDDTLPGDDEFTPGGLRYWTWSRYRKKITALAKVIVAAGGEEVPDLVGLCEVENARVLDDLLAHPILAPYRYSYFHREGTDHRGMEVACLCRSGSLESVLWEYIPFKSPVSATRDILHLALSRGNDTLDLFLVHLLSRYSGAGATALLRREQAAQLMSCMDSVYRIRNRGLIMAAGDFNDEPGAYSLEPLASLLSGGDSLISLKAVNRQASYKYRGRWTFIDQVLVSSAFRPGTPGLNTLTLHPLLTEDRQYGGLKPGRCYEGYRYQGGISDHLPLVLHFFLPSSSGPGGR
ncbi:MAG: endonuclease [Bacteroidales bacterium]|nr:endonuclease [Bacteroidales bacterium]